jgi:N-acetylglutamate synthase-like GNAT family acetyltransferase
MRFTRSQNLRFANRHIRTISRIIVHPQFRSLGLSTALVRCLCDNCDTQYIEAIAMMAKAHPFFERAGMTRIDPVSPDEPAYFILDRDNPSSTPNVAQAFSLCNVRPKHKAALLRVQHTG